MSFMVLVEGVLSRRKRPDKNGFIQTFASIGFFPTLEAAEEAVEKIKSSIADDGQVYDNTREAIPDNNFEVLSLVLDCDINHIWCTSV